MYRLFCRALSLALFLAVVGGLATAQNDISSIRSRAESGDASAQYSLGFAYEYGRSGLTKDTHQAAYWYKKSSDQGNAAAQNHLAAMYRSGTGGLAADINQAMYWFRKSADQDDPFSQYSLGNIYQYGQGGIPKDTVQGSYWYNRAATNFQKIADTDSGAAASLGDMCIDGIGGMPKDDAKAVDWYRKAANAGDDWGQAKLGLMYLNGRGVSKDDAKALELFKQSANQGLYLGQRLVGFMYLNGRSVKKDVKEAVKWYRMAAEQDDASALTTLASIYEYGRPGVQENDAEAMSWELRAIEHGSITGLNNAAWLYLTSTDPKVRDMKKGLELAQKAVALSPIANNLDTLAEAYLQNKQFAKAIETEQKALEAADKTEKPGYAKQIERYKKAALVRTTSPLGHWHGTWYGDGYVYIAELELASKVPGTVEGKIRWTLESAGREADEAKVGKSAVEHVRGTYTAGSGKVEFTGFAKDDPDQIIGLDSYRVEVGDFGDILYGETSAHGTWSGRIALRRVPVRPTRQIAGTYRLWPKTYPARTAHPDYITINRKSPVLISVSGNDFTAEGATTADAGSYNWKYTEGATGKTELKVNPDGTIDVHVVADKGGESSYVAVYVGGTDPYAPPKTAKSATGGVAKAGGAKTITKPAAKKQ